MIASPEVLRIVRGARPAETPDWTVPPLRRECPGPKAAGEAPAGAAPPSRPAPFDDLVALEEMIFRLKEAVRADPTDANAYAILGVILGRLGRTEASIRAWTTAARLSLDAPEIAAGLAITLSRAGRHAEAQSVLARIITSGSTLIAEVRAAELRALDGRARWGAPDARFEPEAHSRSGRTLSGDLGRFALPDLLEFLANQRASGVIRLESNGQSGAIAMLEGRLIACVSPEARELDEILIELGALRSDMPKCTARAESCVEATYLLSCILVDQGLLDAEALRAAVKTQVESGLGALFAWKDGAFSFDDLEWANALPLSAIDLAADPRAALLEAARVIDEERLGFDAVEPMFGEPSITEEPPLARCG